MAESIDSLVVRLGRCVGGKLADDVAVAVKEMHTNLTRAIEENSSMTDSTNKAQESEAALGALLQAADERIRDLEAQLAQVNLLLDRYEPATSAAIVDTLVPEVT